jgi:hypothetical protein
MQPAQTDAVADLRMTFREHEVLVEELSDGSVWVTLAGAAIGTGWNRGADDIATKLMPTFPDTEPYPFYAGPGLMRREGPQFSQVQGSVHVDGRQLSQISLRTTRALQDCEGLGARFAAILRWLRSPR